MSDISLGETPYMNIYQANVASLSFERFSRIGVKRPAFAYASRKSDLPWPARSRAGKTPSTLTKCLQNELPRRIPSVPPGVGAPFWLARARPNRVGCRPAAAGQIFSSATSGAAVAIADLQCCGRRYRGGRCRSFARHFLDDRVSGLMLPRFASVA